jgi:hypothetical protein
MRYKEECEMARGEANEGDMIKAKVNLTAVTKGKIYKVVSTITKDNLVYIINDKGVLESYSENHFDF